MVEERSLAFSSGGKVGAGIEARQDLIDRAAPDHAARSIGMLGNFGTVAVAPDLIGQGAHALVGLRLTRQARGLERLGPDHRRPSLDEPGDFLQHSRGHRQLVGQHQNAVGHPIGQHQASLLHAHPREDYFRVAFVVIIPRRETGDLEFFLMALEVRRVDMVESIGCALPIEIADVGDKMPLPQ